MGTTLQGKTPGGADATYKWLLHLGQAGALPASPDDAVTVSLGDGTDSPIQLWAGGMRIAGNHALHTGVQTLTGEQRDQARANIAADIEARIENRAPLNGAKATTPPFLSTLLTLTADANGANRNGYQIHLEEVGTAGPAAIVSYTSTSATIRVNPAYYDGVSKTVTDLATDINGLLDYVLHPFSVTSLAPVACPTGWTAITATTSGGIDTDTPAANGQRWVWPSQGRVWVATSLAPTVWQELGLQGQDFVGAAISGTSLTSTGGALVLGSGAAHSQLLSGATGLRINTLPDRTGTLVTLNGAQTFTDTITFAGAVAVNGQLTLPNQGFSAETGAITKALARRLLPFIDGRSTRQVVETFVAGTTADGSVGQWGWSTAAEGTGALSYQQATHVPIGRKLRLLTGTVANQRIYIAGRPSLASGADSYSAITFVFNLTNTYTWDDMRLRFGWSDTTVPYSGGSNYALVEYDASVGASWRYRFDPSSGGSGEVISAIGAHNNTDNNSRAQAVTLVGALYNERKLGGQANHARIIVTTFNLAGAAAHQHSVEVNLATAGALFNARPYVELATLTNAAKSVELSMVASDFSVVLAMASNGGPM